MVVFFFFSLFLVSFYPVGVDHGGRSHQWGHQAALEAIAVYTCEGIPNTYIKVVFDKLKLLFMAPRSIAEICRHFFLL